jgi:hypothetical protein
MIKLQDLIIGNRPANYLPSPGLLNALEAAYMLRRPLLLEYITCQNPTFTTTFGTQ